MDQDIPSFSSKDEEIQYWKDLAAQFHQGLASFLFLIKQPYYCVNKKPNFN
jgi:hypothetical protein